MKEPTDLAALAREVIRDFEAEAIANSVAVATVESAESTVADVDPVRIREVLTNLVSNAIRHTQAGAVTIDISRADGRVAIHVSDTGEGMTPEDLARVFDRFRKGPASTGSGLGLTIARNLVTAHGGEISAASTVNAGTTITVTLPRVADDTESATGRDA